MNSKHVLVKMIILWIMISLFLILRNSELKVTPIYYGLDIVFGFVIAGLLFPFYMNSLKDTFIVWKKMGWKWFTIPFAFFFMFFFMIILNSIFVVPGETVNMKVDVAGGGFLAYFCFFMLMALYSDNLMVERKALTFEADNWKNQISETINGLKIELGRDINKLDTSMMEELNDKLKGLLKNYKERKELDDKSSD